jgi:hypothetical protein
MTALVLGRMNTDLGPIELDHSAGVFTTSRVYADALTGEPRDSIIVVDRASAWEWYDLMVTRGAVFCAFPVEVAA